MLNAVGLLVVTGALWGCTNPFIRRGTKGLRSIKAKTWAGQAWAEVLFLLSNWDVSLLASVSCLTIYNQRFTEQSLGYIQRHRLITRQGHLVISDLRHEDLKCLYIDGLKYVLPWLLNQAGSVVYLVAIQRAPLLLAVPTANSLSFAFTAITGAGFGLEEPLDIGSILGIVLIVLGTILCCWGQEVTAPSVSGSNL